jgi:hypothetical protein
MRYLREWSANAFQRTSLAKLLVSVSNLLDSQRWAFTEHMSSVAHWNSRWCVDWAVDVRAERRATTALR